eukprot:30931-Pelagococcus_subviridis.AAC.5
MRGRTRREQRARRRVLRRRHHEPFAPRDVPPLVVRVVVERPEPVLAQPLPLPSRLTELIRRVHREARPLRGRSVRANVGVELKGVRSGCIERTFASPPRTKKKCPPQNRDSGSAPTTTPLAAVAVIGPAAMVAASFPAPAPTPPVTPPSLVFPPPLPPPSAASARLPVPGRSVVVEPSASGSRVRTSERQGGVERRQKRS